ncbi:3-deoxy-D-manno-octulosonic acid transferase [Stagnimonas aquatica]|uniref:3-deoxy-D-manno-octulosonic acid transferase n=1 Tax=Stagnimonas aquatica TaxID=2689987 RepID=A0A3N0V113_9GAMM|nr:lipid IV(A) 3-deoxy-D-manno-octulosonic acid transferase [Stagnimonas aquatica]ROH86479.1 3-deoxy-D-manno-octulosonic acid transferase [Stagnimonas aquatica]
MRLLYTLLLTLLTPLIVLRLLLKSRELPAYRRRIGERFGRVPRPPQGVAVWVHAVSVGESLAALPLIEALIAEHGERRVWVTTTTPTGSERVTAALGGRVIHSYAPYDLPTVVARFLDRARPAKVVVMETELWPNLFRACARRGIPLLIANARLSPRSYKGYGRVAGFTRATLTDTAHIAAQSALDAERFTALGAPRVSVVGNLKFDLALPEAQRARGQRIRAALGATRPVWIAASTHEGEEEIALAAQLQVLRTLPTALLILVPRHPQRFDAVARLVERAGLRLLRRSALDFPTDAATPAPGEPPQVLLGDSMGEMLAYLEASDLAFVGGSFVPVGGHNILEPAALGKPVLFGPQMHNFLPARELLLGSEAALELAEPSALAETLLALFADPARRRAMGQAGAVAIAANRGALQRLLALVAAA